MADNQLFKTALNLVGTSQERFFSFLLQYVQFFSVSLVLNLVILKKFLYYEEAQFLLFTYSSKMGNYFF